MQADLRLGTWQSVLADVEHVDALIVDAPYGERTHASHSPRTSVLTACERDAKWAQQGKRSTIDYACFTPEMVHAFVASWAPRTRGWFVSITDHELQGPWCEALKAAGRYVFSPLPFVETGSRVRLAGDGPSSWTCWVVVARPRTAAYVKWGTLPGAYIGASEAKPVMGGKSLTLMRALVRDYSRPGDLVCDPCAGGATTLLAALYEGRRAVGAEMDPGTFQIARKRLAKGFTPPLFTGEPARDPEQLDLTVREDGRQ